MKVTSAQAAKMLRKLEYEMDDIISKEEISREFVAAVGEDVESVRPEYSFAGTQAKLIDLENRIRALKHAINVFNSNTVIPEFGMTIDQVLVYLPQLSRRRDKLHIMMSKLPKVRDLSRGRNGGNIIDYYYANYDIAEASKAYDEVSDTLARVQTALDTVNNTVTFELEM